MENSPSFPRQMYFSLLRLESVLDLQTLFSFWPALIFVSTRFALKAHIGYRGNRPNNRSKQILTEEENRGGSKQRVGNGGERASGKEQGATERGLACESIPGVKGGFVDSSQVWWAARLNKDLIKDVPIRETALYINRTAASLHREMLINVRVLIQDGMLKRRGEKQRKKAYFNLPAKFKQWCADIQKE